jgi:MarR family 2-MHQ and catechol resistance regulon transcriptional repressor
MDSAPDPSLKLWVVMNHAFNSIEERLRQQVESHGMSFSEFAVLEVLLHKGPLPIGDVGDRVLLTSGSMTYVVDKLEERGLIGRRPCAEDRRIIYAELTEQGRELIEGVFEEHSALIRRLTGALSPAEQETMINLLKRLGKSAEGKEATEKEATDAV